MTNVYKINLFTYNLSHDDENKEHDTKYYQNYCKKEKILGWGWPRKNPKTVLTLDDYCDDCHKNYNRGQNLTRACNQIKNAKENDYFWTYMDGQWYLGKIQQKFIFNVPKADYPAFGMYRKCEWHLIKNTDFVPGDIVTHRKNDGTVRFVTTDDKEQKECNSDYVKYCEFLYDNWNRLETAFDSIKLNLNFYQLAHTDDLEDLVGLYLQKECGYFVFPSTNKQGTKDYEYKLIQKDSKKEAIIQCKNDDYIPWDKLGKYTEEDIYVLSVKQNREYKDEENPKHPKYQYVWDMGWQSEDGRIKEFDTDKLLEWACKEENKDKINMKILPQRIQNFLKISKGKEDEQITKTR